MAASRFEAWLDDLVKLRGLSKMPTYAQMRANYPA